MIFFFVGVVLGLVILTYGTKKGWLAGKIEALEPSQNQEKSIKEILEEDKESVNPNKSLFETFKDKAETDSQFKDNMTKYAQERKEKIFKGLSQKERELFEQYLRDEIEKVKNQEGTAESYDAFRSYTCEIFMLVALATFLWWGLSQHYQVISPIEIGKKLGDYFISFFGLNKNDKHDL